ncbi:SusC/RagA family TonB-linked outer membrane protein [Parapedobacter composti]|nr:SusC/RagA family TonB-linked outer membrane protein [Parapedobacter composti]
MKTIVLMLTCFLQVSALTTRAQITLDKRNAKIIDVLVEIRKQTGVDFFYDKEGILAVDPVSVVVKDASLEQTLDMLTKGKPIAWSINGGIVTLSPKPRTYAVALPTERQQLHVEGLVVDEHGDRLSNVNVEAFSATYRSVGSRTDRYGRFRVPVGSLDDTLRFTMVGYQTLTEPLRGRPQVNVTLKLSQELLEDVVITGVYQRKAESYTGAAQTITKEELKRAGNVNVFQALKNISPSMVLDNFEMGSNPNTMPQIQVRGNGSLPILEEDVVGGMKGNYLKDPTQPLFILDGFEASIERIFDLDINRIESVTILRDAASKALYGSKAANGVIVIETNRMIGDKPLVTYNASVNVELPDLTSYNLTNAMEKLQAEVIDGMYIANSGVYDAPGQYVNLNRLYNQRRKLALEGLDTYWLAKPLQNGVGQRHSLSVELGNRDLRVLTDLLYNDVKGVMIGSGRRNVGGSVNASYRLDNFLFRNITSVTSNRGVESGYGTFDDYVKMNPYWRAENVDGTIPYYAETLLDGSRVTNPLYNSTVNSKIESSYLNLTNNFYLEWTMIPGLRATLRAGADLKRSDADEFYPGSHTRFETYYGADQVRKGSYQVNTGKSVYYSGDLNVNYAKEIDRHYLFGNLGYNISERSFSERLYLAEGFPSDRLRDIIFARNYALNSRPTGVDGITRDMGVLAAFSYMWDNRFLTDLTYRANASSQFGADKRWASFWSAGLGWNFHNESWFKDNPVVEQLRVRGSLGATGNQNFNTNASIATYRYILESFYQGFPGSQLVNMANPLLQWESSFDYNIGLDAKVKGFGLRFDYYERYTENLLADVSLPNSTGFSSVKDNLGRVKNQGIEVFANYMVWQRGRNFISLNASIETNESKIIELSDAMKVFNSRMEARAADRGNNRPVHRYQDGMSMDAIWAVPSLGIDPATGLEIYLDQDGNTTFEWNANDMIVAGVARPKYQGVLGFSAEFNGFGIAVSARYLGGGQLYNQTLVDRVENVDINYNVDKRVLTGRWLYPGQNALFKRLSQYNIENENGSVSPAQEVTRATTRFVQDRRELTIGAANLYYDFYNQRWLTTARLQRLRLALNMNELGTFSSIGIERGTSYPFSRTMSFSLTATF